MGPHSANSAVEEGSRGEELFSVEMLKVGKVGVHLTMFGKLRPLLPGSVVRRAVSSAGMANARCVLQEDGQVAPLVPSVPL